MSYTGFEDVYRGKWKWDSVAKGTHFVNCWYQRGCNWNVYVKEGVVWREEQAGIYEPIDPKIPDYNPRGCQKGACYSERMYDGARMRHPLKRVGERGAGQWARVSWDEALNDIADKMIDVMVSSDGPGSIVWDQGTAQTNGGAGLAMLRTTLVLDTPVLDVNTEIGDHRPGVGVTMGKMTFCSSSDDLFYSDLILIWGGNPDLHPDSQCAFHARGPLQRRQDHHHRTRLLRLLHPRRPVGAGEGGDRCSARAVYGACDDRRGAVQPQIHPGADRPAAAGAYRQRPLPARVRPRRRRRR
ncbi:MAG: molybdopterin-dependent oxidoreductase [Gammaproteobacteria bacterium]|nr:molybdopterin-dependent oxidoreductase [Gammaproteobacteria bacterium]